MQHPHPENVDVSRRHNPSTCQWQIGSKLTSPSLSQDMEPVFSFMAKNIHPTIHWFNVILHFRERGQTTFNNSRFPLQCHSNYLLRSCAMYDPFQSLDSTVASTPRSAKRMFLTWFQCLPSTLHIPVVCDSKSTLPGRHLIRWLELP